MGCFQTPRIATSQNADSQACTERQLYNYTQIKHQIKFGLVPLVATIFRYAYMKTAVDKMQFP
jgi:hypothetical protein